MFFAYDAEQSFALSFYGAALTFYFDIGISEVVYWKNRLNILELDLGV